MMLTTHEHMLTEMMHSAAYFIGGPIYSLINDNEKKNNWN